MNRQMSAWSRRQRRDHLRRFRATRENRGPITHVVIFDGTLSSMAQGCETNAGLTYRLLLDGGPRADVTVLYEPGIQWPDWASTLAVAAGLGLNHKIRRAYGYLASRYRPGDRIYLFGFSRGAFAARSLAGVIGKMGLLQAHNATERYVLQAYRHYQSAPDSGAAADFSFAFCRRDVPIEMIGVWDTVKALGLRLPVLWRLTEPVFAFHNHALGPHVRHGFHALAFDETRVAFAPEMWVTHGEPLSRVEQRWFPGAHGDVGGQLGGFAAARPLSNLPLVWMLEKAEAAGLPLPDGWRQEFPADAEAPSVGTMRSWGKLFLIRKRRIKGNDPSETFHPAILARKGVADALRMEDAGWRPG
ncbi:DUF2235 domain-containing protein [Tropicimonas sp. IMCC34043]|uniref:DUF2235 domain-containing protein n=1 Tax=Tropicimonas sp. IMCC34043 TaxID=2248760 RepID=UPI000E2679A5|nr:DUF2235 domain-containing protein [Tropicimonas sp. IMCC34043]